MPERKTFLDLVNPQKEVFDRFFPDRHSDVVRKNGRLYNAYIGVLFPPDDSEVNIVVVEDIRRGNGRIRTDWYFGVNIDNTPPALMFYPRRNREEELRKVITRKNRVAGRDLRGLVNKAIEDFGDF